ncbi:alkaline phosphatase family protein [Fodinisporobacter ferrooxydans]|uniref:Alkaline phosphatase family protein n=1 Tax=Fodinisporobacter ferrooxydans TaxID=2901836 RepID=A0ABY4CHQ9_9BACL|nr:alkaline phosphatase family protein [Alicyclobacillaceae bacterium MYW30-H2]
MTYKFLYPLCASLFILSGCAKYGDSKQVQTPSKIENLPIHSNLLQKFPVKTIDHIVVVIEENHADKEIIGNPSAPYFNYLAKHGASFTNYHAIEHPSQPNYLDIFSGSNQGVKSDAVPRTRFTTANLASELLAKHFTFGGYSEDLPAAGFMGNHNGYALLPWTQTYVRKHNPWADFANLPTAVNLPLAKFPQDFDRLPTVSFVIPNLNHDMHNGTIGQADTWLKQNLDAYVQWAKNHNSLLIVTWDEDDNSQNNVVPTIFVGPMVQPGIYASNSNHFQLLRTIEDLYGLPYAGRSAFVKPIMDIWK